MRMRRTYLSFLVLLAVPLNHSSFAQTQSTSSPNGFSSRPLITRIAQPGEEGVNECPERQDIREERERIRAEFEELDAEHDRLKSQCMDSKGQERAECHANWQNLNARKAALHERRQALKERVESDPGCRSNNQGHKGEWPSRDASPQASPASAH